MRTEREIGARADRSRAAFDLIVVLVVFAACALSVPYLNPRLHAAHGFSGLLPVARYQFCIASLAPLSLMLWRRESFSSYGYQWKRIGPSLLVGLFLSLLYDAGISIHAHSVLWVPLGRQPAIRMALAAGF